MAIRSHRRKRSGVVLLVCLALLVLFMLLGVTFLILSSQYLGGAKRMSNHDRLGDDPQKETETAFYQLAAGTRPFSKSAIKFHDLLRDMYGSEFAAGPVANAVLDGDSAGQFIRIYINAPLNTRSGYFNGRVFTMLNGPAAGVSTRVIDYVVPSSGLTYFVIEMLESDSSALAQAINQPAGSPTLDIAEVFNNYLYSVNGLPFNGTGFGYRQIDPNTGNVDGNLNQFVTVLNEPLPIALLPHFAAYLSGSPETGGANETRDALDYQDMALARNLTIPQAAGPPRPPEPSFHRTALIRFWQNYYQNVSSNAPIDVPNDVIRAAVLRPMPFDHPNFDGGNAAFRGPLATTALLNALYYGPWDVDNDGDGIRESIWLDLDFPLKTMPDGRRYKPLFSFLVQDQDGRLNLNAHSNFFHTQASYIEQPFGPWAGGAPQNRILTRGLGYGPADIAFGNVMVAAGAPGEFTALLNGRYGSDGGVPIPAAGSVGVNDLMSAVKTIDTPFFYTMGTTFASPPDVWGRSAMAIEYTGQPLYPYMASQNAFGPGPGPNQKVDDPYELDLSHLGSQDTGVWDAPYTVAELERLLRPNDADTPLLPSRLLQLAPVTLGNPAYRRTLTTHSMHVPVPNLVVPVKERPSVNGLAKPHYTNLFEIRLLAGGTPPAQVDFNLRVMLPTEMYRGQLFNINRWLGNQVDDNGNGVIDEPNEHDFAEPLWGAAPPINANLVNNDPFIGANRFAPQIFARHLYCMMMFLADQGYVHPVSPLEAGGLNPQQLNELTAKRLAQWAINVVDFRDADGVMTPFEYDVYPFNGWLPMDGNPITPTVGNPDIVADPNNERRVVWGCEYPDLLITEATAFHDTRLADTQADDNTGRKRYDAMGTERDMSLDQWQIPQGSTYLEFYCPRNRAGNNPALPQELYSGNFLHLGRMSGDGVNPVWRVAITTTANPTNHPAARATLMPDTTTFEPDNMNGLYPLTGAVQLPIERVVSFSQFNPGNGTATFDVYYNRGGPVLLAPGNYAVVGSRPVTNFGNVEGPTANETDDTVSPQAFNIGGSTFSATDLSGNAATPVSGPAGSIQQPAGIVCAANPPAWWTNAAMSAPNGIGINVTEPLPQAGDGMGTNYYYKEPLFALGVGRPVDGYFDPSMDPADPAAMPKVPDLPLDDAATTPLGASTGKRTHGFRTDLRRSVFLQRLANPLDPWHALGNPYITVDWTTLDVTVFNGSDRKPASYNAAQTFDPGDSYPGEGGYNPNMQFMTREKGFRARAAGPATFPYYTPTGPRDNRLWTTDSYAPIVTINDPAAPVEMYFKQNLAQTLGYLNVTMGTPASTTQAPVPGTSGPAPAAGYIGEPDEVFASTPLNPNVTNLPFPWLNWLNRPFASPLELMQVPSCSQARLLWEFSTDSDGYDPYDTTTAPPDKPFWVSRSPFAHLLNFTNGSREPVPSPLPNLTQPQANFHRLFDLIETPSPFVGTERWYNPQVFANAGVNTSVDGLRPPFNRISRFRDPGRINLNMVFEPLVFSGLMKGFQLHDPAIDGGVFWNKFLTSREGFEGQNPASFPTDFANPFQAAASADLAPPVPGLRRDGVEATLLRSDYYIDPMSGFVHLPRPMFGYKPLPVDSDPNEYPHFQSRRNSAMRYHGVQRLANLTSNHSNVYAIWITVGYFEVEARIPGVSIPAAASAVDSVHPDGYQLGQEIGMDSGTVKRHRAFYVFDRSIPVAYQPGENHNVDRAVLLKRFIE